MSMIFSYKVIIAKIELVSYYLTVTMTTSYTVKAIPTVSALGEGPHWDVSRQSLYYIDLMANKGIVLRYDPVADKTFKAEIGKCEYEYK